MQVKKLITHGQIAKSMFKKIIYRSEDKWKFYKDVIKQELNNPNKNILKLIRQSYRGPRDDTYQYGEYKNAGYFDSYPPLVIENKDVTKLECKRSGAMFSKGYPTTKIFSVKYIPYENCDKKIDKWTNEIISEKCKIKYKFVINDEYTK